MSKNNPDILPGRAYPLGVFALDDDLIVSARYKGTENCGIALFAAGKKDPDIVLFDASCRTGRICSAVIKGARNRYESYLLYEDGTLFVDPYARKIIGLETFGAVVDEDSLRCKSLLPPYDWRGDLRPQIAYDDALICCLNVRAYTRQDPSVKKRSHRGTFLGLTEKIPYLQSLGVTTVELMPVHEIHTAHIENKDAAGTLYLDETGRAKDVSLSVKSNLWGYQDGYYFAPRASYCADRKYPCNEVKDTIRAFHDAGMEVLLQFYFAPGTSKNLMVDCIRYWVSEYHIDGFHLKSDNIPVDMIASDPMLHDLKIMSSDPGAWRDMTDEDAPLYLAEYGGDFTWRARRFLKGDDLTASDIADAMYLQSPAFSQIRFICNYDGFTLRDLVTYEHKRNEANGENGADGRNDNYGWNCGVEGETRKKAVVRLRMQQMMNALTFVFLTKGTPLLYAGDETGNTQGGNNNPYCQDNPTGWTDWDKRGKYKVLTDYVRFLSSLRKTHHTLFQTVRGKEQQNGKHRYPDLSFHGAEAWQPDFSDTSHSFGVLMSDDDKGDYLYVTYNMYWETTRFALPALPAGYVWYPLSDTDKDDPVIRDSADITDAFVSNGARSIRIFAGRKTKHMKTNGTKTKAVKANGTKTAGKAASHE